MVIVFYLMKGLLSLFGGQESDKAVINGMDVINSEIEDNLIYYTLSEEHELQSVIGYKEN